jgi:proline iminopeptidase
MNRRTTDGIAVLVTALLAPLMLLCVAADAATPLWPEIEPYETGYLKVSDIHEIYYELCGNPKGTPVFVLHGGPGASCSPYQRRFFDPAKFLIVLHDQRGCGKSKPFGEVKENTTQALVADIERLRKHLELGKIILFGGSWGTTLGIAYGETYPESVCAMVLRGLFLATDAEIDYYYHGGVRTFFPDAYDEFIAALPDPSTRPLPNYMLDLIQHGDSTAQWKYCKAWTRYEASIGALLAPAEFLARLELPSPAMAKGVYTLGLFENYYMANRCFLEEGQLWGDIDKIRDIPITIVNGRYDMICPPVTAYRVHEKLPRSKLVIAEGAGHWMGDKPIETALLEAARDMEAVGCQSGGGR